MTEGESHVSKAVHDAVHEAERIASGAEHRVEIRVKRVREEGEWVELLVVALLGLVVGVMLGRWAEKGSSSQ